MERKPWHLLNLIKGEENVENVDCQRCRKSVLGISTYKCSDCKFFVHESCGEEPNIGMVVAHELRDIHHVISAELRKDGEEKADCSLCEKTVPLSLGKNVSIYKCIIPKCKFLTHELCIELPSTMVDYSHNPCHTLFLKPPRFQKKQCDVCGGVLTGGSFCYDCSNCFYRIHSKCATRWEDKAKNCNPHRYIASWKPIEFTCDVCGKKSSDLGFLCSQCGLMIHTKCKQFIHSIKETGHDHSINFTLSLSQDKYHQCQACHGMVNTIYGAYCCSVQECEYVFHLFCGYGIEQQGGTNDSNGCPPYLVGWIGDGKDVGSKKHPSHPEHVLIWKNEEPRDKVCQGCEESIFVPPFYSCGICDFSLHIRCALLPLQVNRPASFPDPLNLDNTISKVPFWCWECERLCRSFSYKPSIGYRLYDVQCALIPDGFTHSLHEHQLFRGLFYEEACCACGALPRSARTFNCKTCDFRVCIKCLTLPLKVRHKYDKHHFLSLVNTLEDDTNENYCQICEKKINQELWFIIVKSVILVVIHYVFLENKT